MVCLVRLASDRFRCDHTNSTGLSSWAYGGSRNTVSQGRAAINSVIAADTWVFRTLRGRQPHLLPAGALPRGQPAPPGGPPCSGIARAPAAVSRPRESRRLI